DHYGRLSEEVRDAFVSEYVLEDGRLTSDAQTAYALALAFELLPEDLRGPAGDRLAALVRKEGNRIATGFAGTPLVCDALTDTGHIETAYDLLMERECPSWLYTVLQGGTTIWERWDSMLPDGTVNPGDMTSFNHYALGAVADWMHRVVAGIDPLEPGYRRERFAARPGGGWAGVWSFSWVLRAGSALDGTRSTSAACEGDLGDHRRLGRSFGGDRGLLDAGATSNLRRGAGYVWSEGDAQREAVKGRNTAGI